jgi:uncharacterized protein (DUF1330 family)
MSAYVIFDVEIHDPVKYQEYMAKVAPALTEAGARYLVRCIRVSRQSASPAPQGSLSPWKG